MHNPTPQHNQPVSLLDSPETCALIDRAQAGDRSVLPQLEQLLKERPEVWQHCGDLAQQAEQAWLTLVAGNDLLAAESFQRRLAAMKAELLKDIPTPTALERLLVERIVVCWLQVHAADLDAARCVKPGVTSKVPTAAVALKRVQAANYRYLAAMKQLALVRKLLNPEKIPRRKKHSATAATSSNATTPLDHVPN